MTCSSCNQPKLSLDLYNGLCLQCSGRQLDKLKSSTLHLVAIWRQTVPELEERYLPTARAQTEIATTTLTECADRLDEVIKVCTQPLKT